MLLEGGGRFGRTSEPKIQPGLGVVDISEPIGTDHEIGVWVFTRNGNSKAVR